MIVEPLRTSYFAPLRKQVLHIRARSKASTTIASPEVKTPGRPAAEVTRSISSGGDDDKHEPWPSARSTASGARSRRLPNERAFSGERRATEGRERTRAKARARVRCNAMLDDPLIFLEEVLNG